MSRRPAGFVDWNLRPLDSAVTPVGCGAVRRDIPVKACGRVYSVTDDSGKVVGRCIASVDLRGTRVFHYTMPLYLKGVRVELPRRVACVNAVPVVSVNLTHLVEADLYN